jgi:hypothetical protein
MHKVSEGMNFLVALYNTTMYWGVWKVEYKRLAYSFMTVECWNLQRNNLKNDEINVLFRTWNCTTDCPSSFFFFNCTPHYRNTETWHSYIFQCMKSINWIWFYKMMVKDTVYLKRSRASNNWMNECCGQTHLITEAICRCSTSFFL